MEQLLYISTAPPELSLTDEVHAILAASQRNNRRDGLTGLLIVGGRRFLQVLEGPADALTTAYARIKADPRHFALVELSRRSIDERAFPEWAMGHQSGAGDLALLVQSLTADLKDASLRAQLRSFAELHARAA